jgi:hypothetical protein
VNLSSFHSSFFCFLGAKKSWNQEFTKRILTTPQKSSNTNLNREEQGIWVQRAKIDPDDQPGVSQPGPAIRISQDRIAPEKWLLELRNLHFSLCGALDSHKRLDIQRKPRLNQRPSSP